MSIERALQVSDREVNHYDVRMKTHFRLISSVWIPDARQLIPNTFKHNIIICKKNPDIIQSLGHKETQLHQNSIQGYPKKCILEMD